jgi:PAS domain S-box-containing protein
VAPSRLLPWRFAGYVVAVLGVAVVTAVLAPFTQRVANATVALAYLLVVLLVAARWGSWPAFLASVLGMLTFNFFFLPPIHELTIEDPQNWVALGAFVITALTAGQLSERARRRAVEAEAGKEAARRASAYNRSLIEASLDAMAAIGPGGAITDVNAAAERLTGRPRDDLVGTDFSECFTDPDRARSGYRQAFREGVVQNSTLGIRHRDGRTIPVLYNASVYRDEKGEVVGVFVVAREAGEAAPSAVRPALHEVRPVMPPAAPGETETRSLPLADRSPLTAALLALIPPIVCAALQQGLWFLLRPFAWFLFYPAVLVSAWIGGRRGGILATILSTSLAWWFFVEHPHSLANAELRSFFPAVTFALTGVLISMLQGRLQKATQRATAALANARAGNERLRQANDQITRLVEQASDGIFLADRTGRTTDVNQAGCRMLGYDRDELVGKALEDLMPNEDAERFRRARDQLAGGGVQIAEFCLRRRDAVLLPVEVSAKILPDNRWQGFVRDITERKRAENELRRLNRAHRAISSCNQALIRATDDTVLLEQICRIAVDQAGYKFCWVGRAENDDRKSVRPIAQAGFEEGYLAAANITWSDDERGRGPTGTCIRERRTVVAKDIASDPCFAPWRAPALERGYASSLSIPLAFEGTAGAMMIYASEPNAFGEEEVALLSELADDLTYGIATLRTRAERNRAQEELRTLNLQLEERVAARTAELRAVRERETETGSRIQKMLLLDEPPQDVRGLRLAALTLPSQRISGDFYGFFRHEENDCLDVLVADVMGKGVPAALLGAATKSHFPEALWHLLATSPKHALPEPKDIVTLAHTHVARHLIDIEGFVTACYARFDVLRRRLELVDCGHTGAIHVRPATGLCALLHGDNLPLGVREGEIYEQIVVQLDVGDVVLFFSDGVTEARNEHNEQFGTERLLECIRKHAEDDDPQSLVGAIRDAVAAFAGRQGPTDDLTCVVVQMVPHEVPIAHAELELRSTLSELHRARHFVERFCTTETDRPLRREAVSALVLAVNEAASNVVKHAYHGREDQTIDILAEMFQDRVSIRLRHLGSPFDPTTVPPPAFDGSRGSGFGLFLIAQSVDTVRYYRDDLDRRCILLEKRREPVARSA